ncbi:MAG: JAB domain-containing protein [Bacteroidetes bacterium]|nr:JAB domain-containing protein [Bacteroidota bacterium]
MEDFKKVAEIQVTYKPAIGNKPVVLSCLDAYTELVEFFPKNTIALQESFLVMYLNRASRVIGVYPLSTGGMTGTVADIRLIIATALKTAASRIILSHNHPSGNLSPSRQDEELTKRIKDACKLFDIDVVDHIIISPDRTYMSMADEGLI